MPDTGIDLSGIFFTQRFAEFIAEFRRMNKNDLSYLFQGAAF